MSRTSIISADGCTNKKYSCFHLSVNLEKTTSNFKHLDCFNPCNRPFPRIKCPFRTQETGFKLHHPNSSRKSKPWSVFQFISTIEKPYVHPPSISILLRAHCNFATSLEHGNYQNHHLWSDMSIFNPLHSQDQLWASFLIGKTFSQY